LRLEGCRRAPDMMAEIVSPLNTVSEMGKKFGLCKEAGAGIFPGFAIDPNRPLRRADALARIALGVNNAVCGAKRRAH